MPAFLHSHTRDLKATFSVWTPSAMAAPYKPKLKPTVKLHFVCNTIHHFFFVTLIDEIPISTGLQPYAAYRHPNRFDSTAKVNRSTLSHRDSTAAIIHSKLLEYCGHRFRLWAGHPSLVSDIVQSVRSLGNTTNTVRVHVDFLHYHVFYVNIQLRRDLTERTFDGGNCGMKPASESATMEMLKKVDFDESLCDGDERCTVCLEELGREEVLCMPCLHRFHGECILKWLHNSHYCPICRFQIPTQ